MKNISPTKPIEPPDAGLCFVRPAEVTVAVLAGGAGLRFGGVDKGWIDVVGQALIVRLISQLTEQIESILIVANRNQHRYAELGYPVVSDHTCGYDGPLTGVIAALNAATSNWVAIVAVDALCLPPNLLLRLCTAVEHPDQAAVLQSASGISPVFALLPRASLAKLQAQFQLGERSLMRALQACFGDEHEGIKASNLRPVDFSYWPESWLSVNTSDELARTLQQLAGRQRFRAPPRCDIIAS